MGLNDCKGILGASSRVSEAALNFRRSTSAKAYSTAIAWLFCHLNLADHNYYADVAINQSI
jgi:hypothetical protein